MALVFPDECFKPVELNHVSQMTIKGHYSLNMISVMLSNLRCCPRKIAPLLSVQRTVQEGLYYH
jgi:predicted cation transporter